MTRPPYTRKPPFELVEAGDQCRPTQNLRFFFNASLPPTAHTVYLRRLQHARQRGTVRYGTVRRYGAMRCGASFNQLAGASSTLVRIMPCEGFQFVGLGAMPLPLTIISSSSCRAKERRAVTHRFDRVLPPSSPSPLSQSHSTLASACIQENYAQARKVPKHASQTSGSQY